MLNGIGCERKKVVVVDDSLANLKTAKIAGFTTVWMRKFIFKDPRKKKVFKPSYVDYVIRSFDALIQNNFDG
jgi:FMN phosphatase YigB (HAD superfamily)